MENLVPDQAHFDFMIKTVEKLHKDIGGDLDFLKDENADLFKRYMAYGRTRAYLDAYIFAAKMFKQSSVHGFDVQDKIFQTPVAKKNDWDKTHLEYNDFFVNKEKLGEGALSALNEMIERLAAKTMGELNEI